MEIIVISPETDYPNEHEWVIKLFEAGLLRYHVRKPRMNDEQLEQYLEEIPEAWRSQVIPHQSHNFVDSFKLGGWHFKVDSSQIARADNLRQTRHNGQVLSRSIHSLDDLNEDLSGWDYVFLSPVFQSISKRDYGPKWEESQLPAALRYCKEAYHTKVFALGGVDDSRVHQCSLMGFDGVVLLGAIWESRYPLESFLRAREALSISAER